MIYIFATFRKDFMFKCRDLGLNPYTVKHVSRIDQALGLNLRVEDEIYVSTIDEPLAKELKFLEFKRDNKC